MITSPIDFITLCAEHYPQCLIDTMEMLPRDKDVYTGTYCQLAMMEGTHTCAVLVVMGRCSYHHELIAAFEGALHTKVVNYIRRMADGESDRAS